MARVYKQKSIKNKNRILEINENNIVDDVSYLFNRDNYKTPVFDSYPYMVQPSMVKSSTSVQQSIPSMFPLGAKLQGYKVGGVIDLYSEAPEDVIYLGTIENIDLNLSFKLTGMVEAHDYIFGERIQSSLANGSLVTDTDANILVTTNRMHLMTSYFPGGVDIHLVYEADTINNISATIAFEFEFLNYNSNNTEPTFEFYYAVPAAPLS